MLAVDFARPSRDSQPGGEANLAQVGAQMSRRESGMGGGGVSLSACGSKTDSD